MVMVSYFDAPLADGRHGISELAARYHRLIGHVSVPLITLMKVWWR
ncbi:hypothetical protein SAMN05661012_04153 [Chitinophaga sancti]|uniref:Uncharacterized protein n=1 Tax=Chitinophaga sancti TaxID=1004 RepID=A0A1K1RRH5_9BACT|nr:hypothetical protein SAMN05661012_04153 [Chitinophaga sancti]